MDKYKEILNGIEEIGSFMQKQEKLYVIKWIYTYKLCIQRFRNSLKLFLKLFVNNSCKILVIACYRPQWQVGAPLAYLKDNLD